MVKPKANRRRTLGEPDAGKPPVRFDAGAARERTENWQLRPVQSLVHSPAYSTNLCRTRYRTRCWNSSGGLLRLQPKKPAADRWIHDHGFGRPIIRGRG